MTALAHPEGIDPAKWDAWIAAAETQVDAADRLEVAVAAGVSPVGLVNAQAARLGLVDDERSRDGSHR